MLADSRTGKNGWHCLVGLLRQSVYGRLAGYEDVNDADWLGRDPATRSIVGGKAIERGGASTSQMGRFETELLSRNDNLVASPICRACRLTRYTDASLSSPSVGRVPIAFGVVG